MFRIRRFWLLVVLAIGATLAAPRNAQADFQLSWNQNSSVIGSDSTNTGFGIFTGSVNGFKVAGFAEGTNSGAFAPNTSGMDLSTISITSAGPGTLILYLTQSGLTSPLGQGTLTGVLTGQFLAGNGTVSMVSYANDTNDLYGNAAGQGGITPAIGPGLTNVATTGVGGTGNALINNGALSGPSSANTTFIASAPYSMTEIITVNFTSSGTVSLSSDGSTTFALPAPAGLILLISGSPALCLLYAFRRRKAALTT
jgi:hypothetical protein